MSAVFYVGRVHSGKRNVTVWRPSVCLSVPSAYTHRDSPVAACDAASVHFGATISMTDIFVFVFGYRMTYCSVEIII